MIDTTFTNQTNYLVRTGLLINDISGHLLIFALCNYEIDKQKFDTFRYVRKVKMYNVFLLIESLRQEKWDNVLQTDDALSADLAHCTTSFAQLRRLCLSKRIRKKSWFTNGIKKCVSLEECSILKLRVSI